MEPKKILIKLSGELLASEGKIFDNENAQKIAKRLESLRSFPKDQISVVVGGGNIFRGRDAEAFKFQDGAADQIGMLSTMQNALLLKHVLDQSGNKAHVMINGHMPHLSMHAYEPGRAKSWLSEGRIVIFGGGLGISGLSTDMTSVCRGFETGVEMVIKVTGVGGLYDADPKKDSNAKIISHATYDEVIKKGYEVMDLAAFGYAKTNGIKIKILSLDDLKPENIFNEKIGSLISSN